MSADPGTGAMIDCLDFRSQIVAVRVGVISTNQDAIWAQEVTDTLNYIDGDLRSARNRCVHDYWWVADDGTVKRGTRAPKVVRPQAYKPLHVKHGEMTEETLPRMRSLVSDVKAHADWLWELYGWFDMLGLQRLSHENLLAKRPRRRLVPHLPGTQYPTGISAQMPRPRP
jgi:hypothetical protein